MNPDVLEQKAREFRKKNDRVSASPVYWTDATTAAFAREIVEECAKSICPHCRNSGYESARRVGGTDWRHFMEAHDARCLASPIWEAFGRKE